MFTLWVTVLQTVAFSLFATLPAYILYHPSILPDLLVRFPKAMSLAGRNS